MKNFFKHYVYPIATLTGSIIGVGFLSLPYITLKVGLFPMLLYVVAITALVIWLHVIFGEISLRTPDHKRFPGFVGFYLGKFPKLIILTSMILASFSVLLVYLIVGSQFLTAMLAPFFGGTQLLYALIYFTLATLLIYFGIKTIAKFEFWALVALLVSLVVIFVNSFSYLHGANIISADHVLPVDWKLLFLPYGAIMFSLWGVGLIPETEEMLQGRKKTLKKIIIISTIIPTVIYLLFIFLVLGISGGHTTESALPGLRVSLGPELFLVALFIGLITTFTACVAQGLLLKDTFVYDMGMTKFHAWGLTCFVPLLLFLLGVNSFIPLISFVGGFLLGVDGLLILLMYKKIGGKNTIIYPLAVVFILGIIYEIVYFIH